MRWSQAAITGVLFFAWASCIPSPAGALSIEDVAQGLPRLLAQDGDSTSSVNGFVRSLSVLPRQIFRSTVRTVRLALKAWTRYARRGARWIALALVLGILDRNLIDAWRMSGLRVLTTYVPLMLYVNLRLFLDRRVTWLGKLLVLAAIAYGIWRHDLLGDGTPFPGLIEDVVFVTLAMRLFLAWSGDDVVFEHASDAVDRWRRLVVQRARR